MCLRPRSRTLCLALAAALLLPRLHSLARARFCQSRCHTHVTVGVSNQEACLSPAGTQSANNAVIELCTWILGVSTTALPLVARLLAILTDRRTNLPRFASRRWSLSSLPPGPPSGMVDCA